MKKDKRYLSVRVRYVVTSIDSRPQLTSKQETSFLGTVHHIPQETQLQILRMDLLKKLSNFFVCCVCAACWQVLKN